MERTYDAMITLNDIQLRYLDCRFHQLAMVYTSIVHMFEVRSQQIQTLRAYRSGNEIQRMELLKRRYVSMGRSKGNLEE